MGFYEELTQGRIRDFCGPVAERVRYGAVLGFEVSILVHIAGP